MTEVGVFARSSRLPNQLSGTLYVLRRWPVIPIAILTTLIVSAIFAPIIAPHDPIKQDLRARRAPPVWASGGTATHLLGADHVGRDIFSRLVHGARISVAVAGIVLFFGVLLGVTLGIIAGYYGGLVDEVIMFIVVVWLGVPFLLIALIVVALLGPSVGVVMVLLISNAWIGFVRNTRAEVFSLKERDYVALARVAGASTLRIIYRHILPGVANTVVVLATLAVGGYILTEATLSFLGAGIPPPTPAWGLMVAEGNDYLIDAWWISVFPGMAIFLVVMSFNFVGDWLRDRWDPRLRQL
jgi:peptide/nickel transport system permease protein